MVRAAAPARARPAREAQAPLRLGGLRPSLPSARGVQRIARCCPNGMRLVGPGP